MPELSTKTKIEVIRELEKGATMRSVSKAYGISLGTVSNIFKRKIQYFEMVEQNVNLDLKNQKRLKGVGLELDTRLFTWFSEARAGNIPISGRIIQEKAMHLAQSLNVTDFKASNGWLQKFVARHNISFKQLSGESAEVDKEVVENWQQSLKVMLEGYEPKDIFNCDETGLFWRGLPTKTLAKKGEEAKGGKLAKERLTVLLACSAVGEKLKPLVIGEELFLNFF
jgi:hypothetical protein